MTESDILAELQRGQLAAVAMLDAWLAACGGREVRITRDGGASAYNLVLRDGLNIRGRFPGDSPVACRANAAEAIRGELS